LNQPLTRKEETRRRIVETASKLFMEKGMDRVGVDEIMRECGLTHGGFYVHFPSKDALISEACAMALEKTTGRWEGLARNLADDDRWNAFVRAYQSGDKDANPACVAAILGPDVARREPEVQAAYVAQLKHIINVIAEDSGSGHAHAMLSFAALVGATALASSVGEETPLAAKILNMTRDELLKARPDAERKAKAKERT
jgi:TetR/AcrR family transcriptional regulator, transcriptional repressor for nem operon